ncbi:signal peptide containing protein [Theileria equi strain WA]|uniref:Signal peptide containing protein n=1 Tax=Theileria equi strain WA TaxID=1537102 RepID=L1LFK5_THEEQ|nr:signal peptide containing protein [Theileria equi strain WA]EKX74054.1 signal peptide containing protein [Theileria equi strain WA]|eukprot:XP_004833506.1 signal peptide containing protein [Theileria equi strain WA]
MKILQIFTLVAIFLVNPSYGTPFFEHQLYTSKVLDLLKHEGSNKILLNTVAKCMNHTERGAIVSTDFIRCVNDILHTDELTNTDNLGFILGNYVTQSSILMQKCYEERNDIIECLRTFGDCLPLLIRNLFGYPEYSFKCKKLINIPNYDEEKSYLDQEDQEEEKEDQDDEKVIILRQEEL